MLFVVQKASQTGGGHGFMNDINPIKLNGIWDEGYALNYHTISSIPIGPDNYGHMRYSTIRTTIGELVYQYKYQKNQESLKEMIKLIEPFTKQWLFQKDINFVLPVPPTNTERKFQPVFEISKKIANILGATYNESILIKDSNIQSKDLDMVEKERIKSTISKVKAAKNICNILIVDDLYQSGATLTSCVEELRKDKKIRGIYVLTMTKTRSG